MVALLAAGAAVLALAVLRPVRRAEVVGESMLPALEPGDRLLVLRTRRLRPGDLVELADPRAPGTSLVKRVAGFADGSVAVAGDNDGRSTDSREFGPVPLDLVRGRPVYRYGPPGRAGRLQRRGAGERSWHG